MKAVTARVPLKIQKLQDSQIIQNLQINTVHATHGPLLFVEYLYYDGIRERALSHCLQLIQMDENICSR